MLKSFFNTQRTIGGSLARVMARRFTQGPRHPRWSLPFEVGVELCGRALELPDARNGHAAASRDGHKAMAIPLSLRAQLDHRCDRLAELAVEIHTPQGRARIDRTLLYVHGGGYFTCSPATHRELAARLAVASGAETILPDYRKAPAHPFPAAIDDVQRVYAKLLSDGVDPDRLFVGGDSAGGGLALALVQRLRASRLPLPRGLVLLSPMVDLTAHSGSMLKNRAYDYLPIEDMDTVVTQYLAGADPRDPLASAVCADLTGFPPTLMLTGGLELFLDQNVALAERAAACGVPLTHIIADDMVHVYPLLAGVSRRARSDIARIGEFIRAG